MLSTVTTDPNVTLLQGVVPSPICRKTDGFNGDTSDVSRLRRSSDGPEATASIVPYSTRVQLSAFELPFYVQLWEYARPPKLEILPEEDALRFLCGSGLPKTVLQQIWTLADEREVGFLRFGDFCAALRLIAHVQNGIAVTSLSEVINSIPQTIPYFDIPAPTHYEVLPLVLDDSIEACPQDHVYHESVWWGVGSAPLGASWMNPDAAAAALLAARKHTEVEMGLPRERLLQRCVDGHEPVTPTEQEAYLRLFRILPLDGDGFLTAEHAKACLDQTGLPGADLYEISIVADRDADGRFSPAEFILAMHLVSLYCQSYSLPSPLPLLLRRASDAVKGDVSLADSLPSMDPVPPPSTVMIPPSASDLPKVDAPGRLVAVPKKEQEPARILTKIVKERDGLHRTHKEDGETLFFTTIPLPDSATTAPPHDSSSKSQTSLPLRNFVDGPGLIQDLIQQKQNFRRQLNTKKKLEEGIEAQRMEMVQLHEEAEKIEPEKERVLRDIEYYDQKVSLLRTQLKETENEVARDSPCVQRESIEEPVQGERSETDRRNQVLIATAAEVEDMRFRLDELRKKKEDAVTKRTTLQHQLKQADQDRGLLLHIMEARASTLSQLQLLRNTVAEELSSLASSIAETEQDLTRVKIVTVLNADVRPRSASVFSTVSSTSTSLQRDAKGYLMGGVQPPLIPLVSPSPLAELPSHSLVPASHHDVRATCSSIPTTWSSASLSKFFSSVPMLKNSTSAAR